MMRFALGNDAAAGPGILLGASSFGRFTQAREFETQRVKSGSFMALAGVQLVAASKQR